ncbi:MAG TPA: hypothetical protein VK157_05325 [Phycisphaerales bacterium]|nr:hypothetical protein [Phycisphaerales bacterium]
MQTPLPPEETKFADIRADFEVLDRYSVTTFNEREFAFELKDTPMYVIYNVLPVCLIVAALLAGYGFVQWVPFADTFRYAVICAIVFVITGFIGIAAIFTSTPLAVRVKAAPIRSLEVECRTFLKRRHVMTFTDIEKVVLLSGGIAVRQRGRSKSHVIALIGHAIGNADAVTGQAARTSADSTQSARVTTAELRARVVAITIAKMLGAELDTSLLPQTPTTAKK